MYNNDYERTIKWYLRSLMEWKGYVENLRKRMVYLRARLKLNAAPKTTHYGYNGGGSGGWNKPSPEEDACIKKEEAEALLLKWEDEYLKYKGVVESLEDDMEFLPDAQKEIIAYRCFERAGWDSIAIRTNRSNSACRAIFRKGVKALTRMYFGEKGSAKQGSLFLPCGEVDKNVDISDKMEN